MGATATTVYRRETAGGVLATAALLALSVLTGVVAPAPKMLGIAWIAFLAMAIGGYVGIRTASTSARGLVWGYGLASGAMVTSAAIFLIPPAIGHHEGFGGVGIATGLLAGFAGHSVGHRLTHLPLPMDRTVAELSAHALAAGTIIGGVYATMPSLGPLLGVAIVSHKGPAGYAAARRLRNRGRSAVPLLLPASGVGIAGLAVALITPPGDPIVRAIVFGFAAGVFLHVAMDFLPRCETGTEVHDAVIPTSETDEHAHAILDRLRIHAVASTIVGGVAVLLAWLVV